MNLQRILKVFITVLVIGILYNALAHYDARPYPIIDIIFQVRHVIIALIMTVMVVGYELIKSKIGSTAE